MENSLPREINEVIDHLILDSRKRERFRQTLAHWNRTSGHSLTRWMFRGAHYISPPLEWAAGITVAAAGTALPPWVGATALAVGGVTAGTWTLEHLLHHLYVHHESHGTLRPDVRHEAQRVLAASKHR